MKNPQRQLQGRISRDKGKLFEERLDTVCTYYELKGFATVEKTPEPMRPIQSLGNGRFISVFEKKAQPDYKGTLKGGREVMFEVKFTDSECMKQSRVSQEQGDYMDLHSRFGALCFVVIGFGSGAVYKIPWDVWKDMKWYFGRKYVTENDLDEYRVAQSWTDIVSLF